jgi:hypothetical protein
MLANIAMYLLQGSWLLALEIQRRCFHVSPLAAAASKVAMSKFDKDTPLPYEKLLKNLEIVKKRYLYEVNCRWFYNNNCIFFNLCVRTVLLEVT